MLILLTLVVLGHCHYLTSFSLVSDKLSSIAFALWEVLPEVLYTLSMLQRGQTKVATDNGCLKLC
jgi:hypothetical protein